MQFIPRPSAGKYRFPRKIPESSEALSSGQPFKALSLKEIRFVGESAWETVPQASWHARCSTSTVVRIQRMMTLETLSTGDLAVLCRKAGEVCARRFKLIADASAASDHPLQDLLPRIAADAEREIQTHLEVEFPDPEGGSSQLAPEDAMSLIRGHLTSLSKGFGEGMLHRDVALFLAESLEEEVSRFYRTLAEHASGSEASAILRDLSQRERMKLRYLREVVLEG
jgi:hypothetical protein